MKKDDLLILLLFAALLLAAIVTTLRGGAQSSHGQGSVLIPTEGELRSIVSLEMTADVVPS